MSDEKTVLEWPENMLSILNEILSTLKLILEKKLV